MTLSSSRPVPHAMTPEQRRRNRIIGLVLLVFVVAVFVAAMLKGGSLFTSGPN